VGKYGVNPKCVLRELGEAVHTWKKHRERLFKVAAHLDKIVTFEECLLYFREGAWSDFLALAVPPE
jgi:hypothetical protein